MADSIANSKRIAKNSVMLTFRLIITMCISLYTSRVVLNALGVEDYGIYNVVGGFVAIFSSLTDSLSRAFSRYMTVAIAKDDVKEQRKVFSANVNILFLATLLIIGLCELIGTWYFSNIVNVPLERHHVVNVVFQLSLLSFLFSLGRIPCISLIIAQERSGAYALFGILDALFKLGIVYLLAISSVDKLIMYCCLLAAVHLLSFIYTALYCKHSFEGFRYIKGVPKSLYKEMFGYASWSFVGISARVFNAQGITLIVNKFCGVVVNAALGIVTQVESCTRQFVYSIAIAVNPQIIKSYTTGNIEYMKQLVIFATKCFAFIVLLYAIPFSIEAGYILKLWLGIVPDYTANLLRLVFCTTLFIVMANPLEVSSQASGDIKRFQFNTSFVLIIVLPIIWVMLYMGLNVYHVYITLVAAYFCIIIVQYANTRKITQIPMFFYVTNVLGRVLLTSLSSVCLEYIIVRHIEPSFARLCFTCVSSVIVTTICAFAIGFTRSESQMVLSLIKSFIKKK